MVADSSYYSDLGCATKLMFLICLDDVWKFVLFFLSVMNVCR